MAKFELVVRVTCRNCNASNHYWFKDIIHGLYAAKPQVVASRDSLKVKLREMERDAIRLAVDTNDTILEAAQSLGLDRTTLSKKMRRLQIKKKEPIIKNRRDNDQGPGGIPD